jgi:hypothetical protein
MRKSAEIFRFPYNRHLALFPKQYKEYTGKIMKTDISGQTFQDFYLNQ